MLKFLLIVAGIGFAVFIVVVIVFAVRNRKEIFDTQESGGTSYITQETYSELNGVYVFNNNPAHVYYFEDGKYFAEVYIDKFRNRCPNVGIVKRYSENTFIIEQEDLLFYDDFDNFSTFVNTPEDHKYFSFKMFVYAVGGVLYTDSDEYIQVRLDDNPNIFREKVRKYNFRSRCQKVDFPDFYAYETSYRQKHFADGISDSKETYSPDSYSKLQPIPQRTLGLPDFEGLFAFDKNRAHIFLFEFPNNFSEYYINSTGRRCVSVGKYWHFGNGCFLIQCNDIRTSKNSDAQTSSEINPDNKYEKEIYLSYIINRQGFFVAFNWEGNSLEERLNIFYNFAATHYNWGAKCVKQNFSLDEYEKMIIQKRLYKF